MSGRLVGTLTGTLLGIAAVALAPETFGTSLAAFGLAASIGGTIGGLAGTFYDTATAPDSINRQQSLTDLSIQTSTLGVVIPQVFGTVGNLAGNIIWATNKIPHEMREESDAGGKGGGPKQVNITTTYTASLDIGLADTRVTGPIRRIKKAYRDFNLITDIGQMTTLIETEAPMVTSTINEGVRYSYVIVGLAGPDAAHLEPVSVSAEGTNLDGPAFLSFAPANPTQYNTLTWTPVPEATAGYRIYRTFDGSGLYGTGAYFATSSQGLEFDPAVNPDGDMGDGTAVPHADPNANDGLPAGWTFYPGTATQPHDPTVEAHQGVGTVPRYPYLSHVVMVDEDLGRSGRTFNYTFELEGENDNSLTVVVPALCLAAGLTSEQLDITDLPAGNVNMALVSIQAVRAPLQQLAAAFRFYVLESGLKLKFREIGSGDIVATIPEDDLDVTEDESQAHGLRLTRVDDIALPTEVDVTYSDAERNYQSNTQKFQLGIQTGDYEAPRTVTAPLVLDAQQGKQLAQELTLEAWLKRETGQTTVSRKYAALEPGDRARVTSRDLTYTMVLNQTTYGRPGILELQTQLDAAFVRGAQTAEPGIVLPLPQVLPLVGDTTPLLVNLYALDSNDRTARYHVAYIGANEPWEGGALFRSVDAEATYQQVDVGFLEAITGTVTSTPPAADWHYLDVTSSITVVLEHGALTSIADAALYAGQNLCAIGTTEHGYELLSFGVATLIGTKTYTLTRLLRGRQGTEHLIAGHASGENFILLDSGARAVSMDLSDQNIARPYKAVTFGQNISDVSPVSFTPTAQNLTLLSVANPRAERVGLAWVFTWFARSRFNGPSIEFDGIAFDLDFAGFYIRIATDNTYAVIAHSILTDGGNALEPNIQKTWTYTEAEQIADFGSAQATLYWSIYQVGNNRLSYADLLVAA